MERTETILLDQATYEALARGDDVVKEYSTPFGKIKLVIKREIPAWKGAANV